MIGGADLVWNKDYGQMSALVRRLTNAKTIDFSLRSSHRIVDCPGADDGENTCARYCAAEHLGTLRAFTVAGARYAPSPPSSPPSAPEYEPPSPPFAPFTACANTCPNLAAGDTKCRDGGFSSFLPTVCEYSTNCAACGFRENTQTIVQDNSCATANNGVCEDGDFGSMFVFDTVYGGVTSVCGLGTDKSL